MASFAPATRKRARLRMAIDGPSGSGKSVTGLRIAKTIADKLGGRIAVIDTESGSASLYVGQDYGEGPLHFAVRELTSFAPTEYTAAIDEAGRLGFDVLVIDSLSHAWEGKDGALELVGKSNAKNSYTAWKDVTPMHRRMIDAILNSPCHVIATMRSKTEHVLETNEQGKQVPRKIGMAPVQRSGMEYEFTIYGSMDWSHIMTVTKSRCSAVDGLTVVKPGAAFIEPVMQWLETGESINLAPPPAKIADATLQAIISALTTLNRSIDAAKKQLMKQYSVTEFSHLTAAQGDEVLSRLVHELEKKGKKSPAPETADATATQAAEQPSVNGTPTATPPGTPFMQEGVQRRSLLPPDQQARDDQLATLRDLKEKLTPHGLDQSQWLRMLGRYNVTSGYDLRHTQAEELIVKLRGKLAAFENGNGQPADNKSGNGTESEVAPAAGAA